MSMDVYEDIIRNITLRYFNNNDNQDIKVNITDINKFIDCLLKDDEFLNNLDFVIIDKIEKVFNITK